MRETITATGEWSVPLFDYKECWNINDSSILTELIHCAGRYTESYASDLFITWKYCVDNKLSDPDLESFSILFGFRENGVDSDTVGDDKREEVVAKNMKENTYYYRRVKRLDVTIEGLKIKMELKEID